MGPTEMKLVRSRTNSRDPIKHKLPGVHIAAPEKGRPSIFLGWEQSWRLSIEVQIHQTPWWNSIRCLRGSWNSQPILGYKTTVVSGEAAPSTL